MNHPLMPSVPMADCHGEPDPDLPKVGDRVRHKDFGWLGTIEEVDQFGWFLIRPDVIDFRRPLCWLSTASIELICTDLTIPGDDRPF